MGCECAVLVYRAIGADLSTIGEGTFGNNNSLVSITVATGNPTYCSVDNILYSRDMAILFLAGKKSAPPKKKYALSPHIYPIYHDVEKVSVFVGILDLARMTLRISFTCK